MKLREVSQARKRLRLAGRTRRPAKNNLLNALSVRAIVPDKTTDVYIYAIQGRSSKKGITPA